MEYMSMYKNIMAAFAVVVLLSGCGGGKGFSSSVSPALERDFVNNVGDRVFYAFDSNGLTNESKATLKRQAEWLRAHPNIRASVQGHCDVRGTREYNLGLGERRSHAARKYLETEGVSPDRLETISYGKERPADLGADDAAHAKNRRAVTALQ
jgi:peptidoglycan-associated lipoprotein